MDIAVLHNGAFVGVSLGDQTYIYAKGSKGSTPHSFAPRSQWSALTLGLPGGRWEGMPRREAQEWVAKAQKFAASRPKADYKAVEERVLASASPETRQMIADAQAGKDIHRETAAKMFDVAPEAVTDDQRRDARAANFTLLYGPQTEKVA